jgi:hypothetical protein
MGLLLFAVGAVGLAIVFPFMWFVYLIFIGLALLSR